MTTPPALAWIGAAHIHTPGFVKQAAENGLSAVGVWDHDQERARKTAEKLACPVLSLDELAGHAGVSGFVVCSETNRHLDLVRALAPAGKPIFVEKPMGTDGAVSAQIQAEFESSGCVFQTGYFMRGTPAAQTLKKRLDEGFFGEVTRVRGSVCHSGALGGWFDGEWRWMADRSQAGVGAYGDLGTHALDLLMWMFGGVSSVAGAMALGTARYPGCEETGEAILKFESGVIGTLAAAWDDVANPFVVQVSGTTGHALLSNDGLRLAGPDGKLEPVEELEPAVPAGFGAFLRHLAGEQVSLVTPSEAAARDRVMSAIYEASESESWVRLPTP